MADEQEQFDALVRTFNDEYIEALQRAASGNHRWLVEVFTSVKDLHDLIVLTYERKKVTFRVPMHPITIQGNEQLFEILGFSGDDLLEIGRFLAEYREVTGRAFDAVRPD